MLEYHRIIDAVEKKYGVDVRDYAGLFGGENSGQEGHFEMYCRVMNDPMPFGANMYPDVSGKNHGFANEWTVIRGGERVEATKEEYDADFKLIHEQYARYKVWKLDNPEPPYLDFWHWMIDGPFADVCNGCDLEWSVREIAEDESNPDWVRSITKLVLTEYEEHLDGNGSMIVHISW